MAPRDQWKSKPVPDPTQHRKPQLPKRTRLLRQRVVWRMASQHLALQNVLTSGKSLAPKSRTHQRGTSDPRHTHHLDLKTPPMSLREQGTDKYHPVVAENQQDSKGQSGATGDGCDLSRCPRKDMGVTRISMNKGAKNETKIAEKKTNNAPAGTDQPKEHIGKEIASPPSTKHPTRTAGPEIAEKPQKEYMLIVDKLYIFHAVFLPL